MKNTTRNTLALALIAALASPVLLQAAEKSTPAGDAPMMQGSSATMPAQMQGQMQARMQSMQARMQAMQQTTDPQARMSIMSAQMQDMQSMMKDFNTGCPMGGGAGGPGMMGGGMQGGPGMAGPMHGMQGQAATPAK